MQPDVTLRPAAAVLKAHAFFNGLDWEALAAGTLESPLAVFAKSELASSTETGGVADADDMLQ